MKATIERHSDKSMTVIQDWWEVMWNGEMLFWDEYLDRCKAFCEAHKMSYTVSAKPREKSK